MKNERKTLKNVLKWPKPKAQTGHPGAKMVPLPYEIKKKQKKQKSEKNKKMKNSRKIKKKNQPTRFKQSNDGKYSRSSPSGVLCHLIV